MHGKKRARRCSFRSSDRGVRSQLTSTNPQMSRPPIREAKQQSRCCSKPPMRLVFGAQAAADSPDWRFSREATCSRAAEAAKRDLDLLGR